MSGAEPYFAGRRPPGIGPGSGPSGPRPGPAVFGPGTKGSRLPRFTPLSGHAPLGSGAKTGSPGPGPSLSRPQPGPKGARDRSFRFPLGYGDKSSPPRPGRNPAHPEPEGPATSDQGLGCRVPGPMAATPFGSRTKGARLPPTPALAVQNRNAGGPIWGVESDIAEMPPFWRNLEISGTP